MKHGEKRERKRMKASSGANAVYCCLIALALLISASGCGGGGSSVGPSGSISIEAQFQGAGASRSASRAAEAQSPIQFADAAVTGYNADGSAFGPINARLQINAAQGTATGRIQNIPAGTNHVVAVTATYQNGSTESVKCIVPSVSTSGPAAADADERTTVIADAAIALAEQQGGKLSEITSESIANIAATVDELKTNGTDYDDMEADSVVEYDHDSRTPETIEISPGTLTAFIATAHTFTATVKNGLGETMDEEVTWSVSESIGTISVEGVLSAMYPGSGSVTATVGSLTATVPVTVMADFLVLLTVTPPSMQMTVGSTQQYTARGRDQTGWEMNITPTWSVSGGVGTIDSNGIFTATTPGGGSIIATSGSLSGGAGVTVLEWNLHHMVMTPASATVNIGETVQFDAVGVDTDGNTVEPSPITWTVVGSNGGVDQNGLFTASNTGTSYVSAGYGPNMVSAPIEVICAPPNCTTVTARGAAR